MTPAQAAQEPLTFPGTVIIDSREGLPYGFTGLRADAREGRRPLLVPTRVQTLETGDYSLEGHTDRIAVERKSAQDLFHTLGQERERFERELARLNALEVAAVVVEADWLTILKDPPPRSLLNPKTVFRSVLAWQQRYSRVHWWTLGSRRLAEATTFRILERFLRNRPSGGG